MEKRNKLAKLRQEAEDASKDMEVTNSALHDYRTLKEELDESQKPTIHDYYKPSSRI